MRPDGSLATPRHVVVVERDMIVGLSVVEDLVDLGFRVSGPFISAREVVSLIDTDPPDFGIVDLGLRDGSGADAARAFCERSLPLVFFCAGGQQAHLQGEFRNVPWVEKPASTAELLRAMSLDLSAARVN